MTAAMRVLDVCRDRPRLLLSLCAVLLAAQISSLWYATPDTVVYLSMARSLARTGHLTRLGSEQLGLPPGYPWLISPALAVVDRPFLLLSILHWGLAVILMLGLYRWVRGWCPHAAAPLTALVVVNVSLWIHYRRPLSEVAFMTALLWTALAFNAAAVARRAAATLRWTLVGSMCLLLLTMIREVGITVAAGFATALLVQVSSRRRSRLVTAAVILIACLPASGALVAFVQHDVAMTARVVNPTGTHLDGFVHAVAPVGSEGSQLAENLRLRVSEVGRLLVPGMFKAYGSRGVWFDLNMLVYLPLVAFVAVGWWRFVRHRADVLAWTLPYYLGVYFFWPFAADTRYMLPMLPVLVAAVWFIIAPLGERALAIVAVLVAAHLAVALGYWLVVDRPRAVECDAVWPAVQRLVAQLPADASPRLAVAAPDCVWMQVELAIDRRVMLQSSSGAVGEQVDWLVVARGAAPTPGFVTRDTAGDYTLLVRAR